MSRRPATITQADVARIIRAAQQTGTKSVVVKVGDAEVIVSLDSPPTLPTTKPKIVLLRC